MTCDAVLCQDKGNVATLGYGVMIEGLDIEPGWVRCAGDQSPLVKITKDPTDNRYRVLVTCPSKSNDGPPQS